MTCSQCCGIEQQFSDKVARRELKKYRRRGPGKTTTMLLDLIMSANTRRDSLLDIGGGVGAIQHAMAASGADSITSVDASPAYLDVSRSEAEERGYADRATYIADNFVDAAERVPEADVVTLDRVICCYHDVDALLGSAASKARYAVGLVFPRERFHVRLGMGLLNRVLGLIGRDFRAFVHPHAKVERILADRGFRFVAGCESFVWRVALFAK